MLCVLGHRLEPFNEQFERLGPRFARVYRAARLGRDAGRAELSREAERAPRMIDADLSIVAVRLDPGRVPVGLSGVTDRFHHERVHVRNAKPMPFQLSANCLFLSVEQAGGPGVRHVGHDLHPGVTDLGQPAHRFREGRLGVRIRAEGEPHAVLFAEGSCPYRGGRDANEL